MNTGIVVLNYNDAVSTSTLVDSISGYASISHIAVIDNCSTDASMEILTKSTKAAKRCLYCRRERTGDIRSGIIAEHAF